MKLALCRNFPGTLQTSNLLFHCHHCARPLLSECVQALAETPSWCGQGSARQQRLRAPPVFLSFSFAGELSATSSKSETLQDGKREHKAPSPTPGRTTVPLLTPKGCDLHGCSSNGAKKWQQGPVPHPRPKNEAESVIRPIRKNPHFENTHFPHTSTSRGRAESVPSLQN